MADKNNPNGLGQSDGFRQGSAERWFNCLRWMTETIH